MEKLMDFVKRKSFLEYEMNSIEKYVHGGDSDNSLQKAYSEMETELKGIETEIDLLSDPVTKEVEMQKLELLEAIKSHEAELIRLRRQVGLVGEMLKE